MQKLTGINIYTYEQIEQAIKNHLGNTGLAAAELNVPRHQLVVYMAENPALMQIKKDIEEAYKDDLEDILVQKAKTDNNLLMFYMRTKAADRGYGNVSSGRGESSGSLTVNARSLIATIRLELSKPEQVQDEESEQDEISRLLTDSTDLVG